MSRLGIIVALPAECRALTTQRMAIGDHRSLAGGALLAVSGIGPKLARRSASRLLDKGVTALLNVGCAAALHESLKPGDLVLPNLLIEPQGARYEIDHHWYRRLYDHLSEQITVHQTPLVSSDQLIVSRLAKRRLAAQSRAFAADMEAAALARLAQERHIPFIALRAIADPMAMSLPHSIVRAMDHSAGIHTARLMAGVIAHPADLIGLIRLGQQFRAALATLRRVVQLTGGTFLFNSADSRPLP